MKRLGSSDLPGVAGRTRSELKLHRRLQSTPTSTISQLSRANPTIGVQEQNELTISTVPTETPGSGKKVNETSETQGSGSSLSFSQTPRTTWTNVKATPFSTSSATTLWTSETPRKLSSTWSDQLSEATVYFTTQITGTVQPGNVGETETSSHTFLATAPDRASTHVKSEEQPWRTSSVTAWRTSDPPKNPSGRKPSSPKPSSQKPSSPKPSSQKPSSQKPSSQKPSSQKPSSQKLSSLKSFSSWNDQLSDAALHPMTQVPQVTVTKQSSYVNPTELPSRTFLAATPEQSSPNAQSEVQSWRISSATAWRTSDLPRKLSSSWNHQLSDATVYPIAQITATSQSHNIDKSEPSTHTFLATTPDRSSTHANSRGQSWPTRLGSPTASPPSSLDTQPDGTLLDGHTSSFPSLSSGR